MMSHTQQLQQQQHHHQQQLSPELLEEAVLFGDGCTPAAAKRLFAIFMSMVSESKSNPTELTLDDFCRIPEITHHPLRKRLFHAAQQFPPALNSPGCLQFVQFVRLFTILSLDGLRASKIKLVFDVISECRRFISRPDLTSFIALISECEDEDIDYVVDQVFLEIAPGLDGISFASFSNLVVLADSFVSTVIIPLAMHSHSHSLEEMNEDDQADAVGIANDEELGFTNANRDLEGRGVELATTITI